MKKSIILLLVSLFLLINQANAQTFTNYTTATTSTTLCNNEVFAITIDAKGNMWFGTYDGASEFDGTKWTSNTTEDGLTSNFVTAISIDSEGSNF